MKRPRPTVLSCIAVPVAPQGKVVRVGRGTGFKVRVDAQLVSEVGAVTYPLVFVMTGARENDAPREAGVPVTRALDEEFTADEDEITLSADEACTAWIYTLQPCGCDSSTPGGCGCSK